MALSCQSWSTNSWCVSAWVVNGPLTKATCWWTGQRKKPPPPPKKKKKKKKTVLKLGNKLPKREIFVMQTNNRDGGCLSLTGCILSVLVRYLWRKYPIPMPTRYGTIRVYGLSYTSSMNVWLGFGSGLNASLQGEKWMNEWKILLPNSYHNDKSEHNINKNYKIW